MSNRKPLIIDDNGYLSELNHPTDEITTVNFNEDSNIDFINSLDGDGVVIIGGKLVRKPQPIIVESITGDWNTTTNDIDNPITNPTATNTNVALSLDVNFREVGFWKPFVSFLYAADSQGADFEAICTIDGNEIARCQPLSQLIIKEEGKDAAGQNPDNSSAGTAQVKSYGQIFHAFEITATGNKPLVLLYGPEAGGIEANIGEITIIFQRVYNIQKP